MVDASHTNSSVQQVTPTCSTPSHSLYLDGSGGEHAFTFTADAPITADRPWWVHLNYEAAQTRDWLEQHSGLTDVAIEGLLAAETRPRVVTRGDNLLIIARGVNLNPGSEPDDMVSARIWTDGKRIISTQARRLLSTCDLVDSLKSGDGPCSIPELLVQWLGRIVDRMDGTLENLEDVVATLEERGLAGERSNLRGEFAHIRRQCITLRRYLAPQREALARLSNEPLIWMDDMNRLRLREVADRQVRHVEALDEIRERAAVAYEELISQLSEEMNERMYVMSIAAALFLPLGFFTGLMGINVGGMPGVESPSGFWMVVGVCGAVLTGLVGWFKHRGWM